MWWVEVSSYLSGKYLKKKCYYHPSLMHDFNTQMEFGASLVFH